MEYIEKNLCEDISVERIAAHVCSSYSNFSRIFCLVTGTTLSEYLRNRRLSQAGRELLTTDIKIIDLALKYQYDTSESFSKAFTRFHGIPPSDARRTSSVLEYFYPFSINISVGGGYSIGKKLIDEFCWHGIDSHVDRVRSNKEKYSKGFSMEYYSYEKYECKNDIYEFSYYLPCKRAE